MAVIVLMAKRLNSIILARDTQYVLKIGTDN